jgi:hypothetical protein
MNDKTLNNFKTQNPTTAEPLKIFLIPPKPTNDSTRNLWKNFF